MTTQPLPEYGFWTGSRFAGVSLVMAVWFAIAYVIGTEELLVNTDQSMFAPVAISAVVPVVLFFTIYNLSARFRGGVHAQGIKFLTAIQLWRIIGFTFLALYFYDVLPGLFALPAGFGDVAVGLMALYMLFHVDRNTDFARTPAYVRFHLFGLLDFAVAIGTAGLASGAFPGLVSGGLTSAPMDVWPLNLFPSFIVPAFMILQIVALLKVREMRRKALGVSGQAVPAT